MPSADAAFSEILQKDRQTAMMLFYRYGAAGYPRQQPGWIAHHFGTTATEVRERTDRVVGDILALLYAKVTGFEIPRRADAKGSERKAVRKTSGKAGGLALVKGKGTGARKGRRSKP